MPRNTDCDGDVSMVKFPKPSLRKRRVRYDRAIRAMLDERPSARLSSRRPGSCAVSSRKRLPGGSHSPSRSKVPELFGLLDDRIPNSTYSGKIPPSRSQSHTEETGEAPHEPIVVDPAPGRILPSRVSQVPWTDNTSKVLFFATRPSTSTRSTLFRDLSIINSQNPNG